MKETWEDLEDDWEALRPKPLIEVTSARASDLKSQLETATLKAEFEFKNFAKKYNGEAITSELLTTLMVNAVRIFMMKWHEGLRDQNLAGLIEIVLEGQNLTPSEMKGFLKALPTELLDKIMKSTLGSWTTNGVHALIAMESNLRAKGIKDYTLGKDFDRTYVEFDSPKGKVRFFLDDLFEGVSDKPAT